MSEQLRTLPGVAFSVFLEIGDGVSPGLWDSALWGTDLWGGSSFSGGDLFKDVSPFVRWLETDGGRERFVGRFATSTMRVALDNTNGEWTEGGGAPLPGFLPLRPGRRIFFEVATGPSPVRLWTGYVESLRDLHDQGDLVTEVDCLDVFARLAVNNTLEHAPAGAGESVQFRAQRILDNAFDTDPPTVTVVGASSGGNTAMNATTLADDALSMLQIAADSEGGAVWVDADGDIVFALSEFFGDLAAAAAAYTFGPGGDLEPSTLEESDWSAERIVNEAHIARSGGATVSAHNQASIDVFGRRTHRRLDLEHQDEAHSQFLADRLVADLAIDRRQLTGLTVIPTDVAETDIAAAVSVGDVLDVTVATIHGWSYQAKTQVFGIAHYLDPGTWTVTFLVDNTEIPTV